MPKDEFELVSCRGVEQRRVIHIRPLREIKGVMHFNLGKITDCEVIGDASDGAQALAQAQELQPDLDLPDIGHPTKNGGC
jgi:hypothetical protein